MLVVSRDDAVLAGLFRSETCFTLDLKLRTSGKCEFLSLTSPLPSLNNLFHALASVRKIPCVLLQQHSTLTCLFVCFSLSASGA